MMNEKENADSFAQFSRYIAESRVTLKTRYQQVLAEDLSRQQWDHCFQRNVLKVLEQAYDQALSEIKTLVFDSSRVPVTRGYSDLSKQLMAEFDGFVDDFLVFVVDKHRTSCALSNFPDEHKPDVAYVNEVKREIAGLWQNFALNVNAHILECKEN
jgi:monoamine oxidase